jgi:hypothetical protein
MLAPQAAEELEGAVGALRGQAARVCGGYGAGIYQQTRSSAMRVVGRRLRGREQEDAEW